jgi:hypothetical protein
VAMDTASPAESHSQRPSRSGHASSAQLFFAAAAAAASSPATRGGGRGLGEGGWAIIDTSLQPTTVMPLVISFVQAMQPRAGPAVGEQI